MKKDGIKVTFAHSVTRDELIKSLDQILRLHGCLACGLNGWGGIHFLGDPEPFISELKGELMNEKVLSVINVEQFAAPAAEFNRSAQF